MRWGQAQEKVWLKLMRHRWEQGPLPSLVAHGLGAKKKKISLTIFHKKGKVGSHEREKEQPSLWTVAINYTISDVDAYIRVKFSFFLE